MKAIVQDRYGEPDVLAVKDIDRPTPGDGEVLLRVRAAAVNPLDVHNTRGLPYPLRIGSGCSRPVSRVPGVDVAGQVEAVSPNVARFRPGDEVFGLCTGAFAEYASAAADRIAVKPARLTFEQAAAVPVAALTALQGLRDRGRIQTGQNVLVVGAGGGVGTFAVQIAKWFGAVVTGVCSTTKLDLVRSLGADRVIDYSREDFTQGQQRYDLILDMAGTEPLAACRRALQPGGSYVLIGAPTGRWIKGPDRLAKALVLSLFVRERMVPSMTRPSKADLELVRTLADAGTITPVIDRTYALHEASEAVRHVAAGHTCGKVVISVRPEDGQ